MRKVKHPVIALGQPDANGQVPIAHISHNLPSGVTGHDPADYGIPSNQRADGTDHKIDVSSKVTAHLDKMAELSSKHPLSGHVVDQANVDKLKNKIGM